LFYFLFLKTLRPVSTGRGAAAFLAAARLPAAAVAMPVTLPMIPPLLTGAGAFFLVTTVVPALASDVLLPSLGARPRVDLAAGAGAGVGAAPRLPRTEGAAGLLVAFCLVARGFSVLAPATEALAAVGAGFAGEGTRTMLGLTAGAALSGDCGRVRELRLLGERTWPASSLREVALLAAAATDTGAGATRVRFLGSESSCAWFSLSEPGASGPVISALQGD
jgi:hypothetical protein